MAVSKTRMTAYCGLYCAECAFNTGTVPDLARDLRKELRRVRFDKAAEVIPFIDAEVYEQAYEFLGSLVKMRCKGCKVSIRSRFCGVAQCAIKNGFEGCWECDDFADCPEMAFLIPVHGDAHVKNLRKIKRVGVKEWVDGGPLWYSKPKRIKVEKGD